MAAFTDSLHYSNLLEREIRDHKQTESELAQARDKLEEKVIARTKQLQESEERFHLAMLGANDGLWDWNLLTDRVYYSPRWKSMLGYAEEELESHLDTWKRVVHPEDLERSLYSISDFLEGRADKYELEFRLQHKDGHYSDILSRATLVRGADGKPLRLVGTHVDITERKQSEEKLRKSEQQLLESQRVAHLGSWDLNLVSQELEWSDETYRLFDKSPGDFVPSFNEFARLVHPDDHATMETNFLKALESDTTPYHVAVRIINDSGREWVMEAFGVVRRDSSGKALSIFGTAQDITEQKKDEEQIQQSLLEKETLLRELYHRTKNNMQVIASLLNLQSRGIDDKKTLQILEDTKNRIHSMALVHEKLYKAKNLSQVYLSDYIKDLANALMKSHNAGKEQISLHIDVGNIPVSIDTIVPLGLVINELTTNTLKYAFPGNKKGEIIIKARLNEEGIIELTFSDNGIGMSKNINLNKTESLGLTLVRTLVVSQIKGKLEMQTQNGTTFIIKFKDKDIPARI
jgi:PAS domain S-box-containing protein